MDGVLRELWQDWRDWAESEWLAWWNVGSWRSWDFAPHQRLELFGEGAVGAVAGVVEAEVVVDLEHRLVVGERAEEVGAGRRVRRRGAGRRAGPCRCGPGRAARGSRPRRRRVLAQGERDEVVGEQFEGAFAADEGDRAGAGVGGEGVAVGPERVFELVEELEQPWRARTGGRARGGGSRPSGRRSRRARRPGGAGGWRGAGRGATTADRAAGRSRSGRGTSTSPATATARCSRVSAGARSTRVGVEEAGGTEQDGFGAAVRGARGAARAGRAGASAGGWRGSRAISATAWNRAASRPWASALRRKRAALRSARWRAASLSRASRRSTAGVGERGGAAAGAGDGDLAAGQFERGGDADRRHGTRGIWRCSQLRANDSPDSALKTTCRTTSRKAGLVRVAVGFPVGRVEVEFDRAGAGFAVDLDRAVEEVRAGGAVPLAELDDADRAARRRW